jgi:hypothetical protein
MKLFFCRNNLFCILLFGTLLSISNTTLAQVTFTSSNLPIVIITTDNYPNSSQPQEILDSPRVFGNMKIIKRPDGTRNYMTDANTASFLNYTGRISIEIRGSSSQTLPKKQYGLTTLLANNTTNNNVSLLGMPSENDWILNGMGYEPSLIRDYLFYNLSRQMGNYASRTSYCEVVVNGDYVGLYVLQEKIKPDSNRVDIFKILTTENSLPNLSGGYITKSDKTTGGDPVAWGMNSYAGYTDFIHEFPDPSDVTTQQNNYIKGQFLNLETAAHNNNISLSSGIPSIIDVPTFVDFMLLNELGSNADGYQFSTYFHKDRNGKLRAGPIWDFNLSLGNDLFLWGFDRSHYDVWQFSDGGNEGARFWTDLFNNSTFKCYLSKRWNQLTQTGNPLNYNSLVQFIDTTITLITEASIRENQRWESIPNLTQEIANMKVFIANRINWITNNIGPFSSCNVIQTPQLVINKINYNPSVSGSFPISNDQEFIAIINAGTTTVNLTGYYFKELGFTYQFPASSTILPNQTIYLASNSATFQSKYGITAFGQFTRNLSNSSDRLILADGFGNTIDFVEYSDVSPWPTAPDGNGSYLQLVSTNLDNNLASSWIASSNSLDTDDFVLNSSDLKAFPNPVNDQLTIQNNHKFDAIELFDYLGKMILKKNCDDFQTQIDMNGYSNGMYFIKVYTENNFQTLKVIKQ